MKRGWYLVYERYQKNQHSETQTIYFHLGSAKSGGEAVRTGQNLWPRIRNRVDNQTWILENPSVAFMIPIDTQGTSIGL